jgi:hypothetical protein
MYVVNRRHEPNDLISMKRDDEMMPRIVQELRYQMRLRLAVEDSRRYSGEQPRIILAESLDCDGRGHDVLCATRRYRVHRREGRSARD